MPSPRWTRRDSLAALALFLLPWALFQSLLGLIGPRHYLAEGDFTDQFLAFGDFAVRELAAGRLPLWNPFAYGGAPFWADIQSAVAYLPNLLLYLVSARLWGRLPLLALEASVLLHLGLCAAFTYAFARRHLGDRGGAFLAALSFGLGGYLTGYPMLQLAILQAVAWLPLLFWAQDRAATQGRAGRDRAMSWLARLRPEPWQALALAMVILAGHAQTALHIGLLGLVHAWWLGRDPGENGAEKACRGGQTEEAGSDRRDVAAPPRRLAAWEALRRPPLTGYLASGLLALLLAAPGWLPALDFMRRSTRASADYAMLSGGFPPAELLGLALPGLTLWSPLYIGLLPLLLALAALARWLSPQAAAEANDPPPPAGEIDGIETPEQPPSERAATETPALAPPSPSRFGGGGRGEGAGASGSDGAGEDRVQETGDAKPPTLWLALAATSLLLSLGRHAFAFDLFYLVVPGFRLFRGQERAAVAVSFSLAMLAGWALARWRQGDEGLGRDLAVSSVYTCGLGVLLATVAAPALRPTAQGLIFLGLVVSYLAHARATRRLRPASLAALLCLLVAADLGWSVASVNLSPSAPSELRPGPLVAALRSGDVQRVDNAYRLPPNFGVLHGVEALSGASPLRLATMDRLLRGLEDRPDLRWDLLAVSHVLSWQERLDLPAELLLSQGEGEERTFLHRLSAAAPRLWWVPRARLSAGDDQALAWLREEGFPRHGAVVLHATGPGAAAADSPGIDDPAAGLAPGQAADLALLDRRPGEVRARSHSPSPGWLVLSEAYDPGWRAWVNGSPSPLYRADLALLALPLPAGEQDILLRYTAPWLTAGLAAALLGGLVWLGLLWRDLRRDEQREAPGAANSSESPIASL